MSGVPASNVMGTTGTLSRRRDAIRDSISFLNGHNGVNIRVTDDAARRGEAALSYLAANVSWGNSQDIRIEAASSGLVGDFPDTFSTSPDLVERGIGLQPEAFADFHFH